MSHFVTFQMRSIPRESERDIQTYSGRVAGVEVIGISEDDVRAKLLAAIRGKDYLNRYAAEKIPHTEPGLSFLEIPD